MTLAASTRLGPYEILSPLGHGGMGEVYRARDTRLDRDVAVKVLPERLATDPASLARFHREAKVVAALSHPNVVAIFDIGEDHGLHFVVMELLEGEPLSRRIKSAAPDPRAAVAVCAAVADGLAAAHARGVVHRDVKPDNVFLTNSGGVKLLDFGLARMDRPAASPFTLTATFETQPGVVLGTVAYMAPEQVRGQPADGRSDIFALGCVLYEAATGRRAFDGATAADIMAAILHHPPPALSESGRDRPAGLDRVIARCLEKEPARRYQSAADLAADLHALAADAALSDSGRRGLSDTHPLAPRPDAGPSVAVLPFVNMSSDPENEYFSDGLAEELINALGKVEGLRVASRTSSFAFKGKTDDVRRIGEQLGVRAVLQGSVRKSGSRLRITAQLGNAADGYQLWSETYNRQLDDVFAIQDEIAQAIAQALRVVLTEKDKRALQKPTTDVRAYDFYLRGVQLFHLFRRKTLEAAIEMFERAIQIDPTYARAYAWLADCHSLLFLNWNVRGDTRERADAASRQALELDPGSAEAHTARGLALAIARRFDDAEREFAEALRLNPDLYEAHYFWGRACQAAGRLEEAARQFAEAARLNPDDYQARLLGAGKLAGLGRTEEAEAAYLDGLRVAEAHLRLYPDDARALVLGAIGWTRLGNREKALDWARRAVAIDSEEAVTLYNVACVYALLGEADRALDTLTEAVRNGYTHKEWIEHDADFRSLRDHPRFRALLDGL